MMKQVYIKHYKCLKTPTIKIVKFSRQPVLSSVLNKKITSNKKKSEINNSTTI